jgi:hypothetical protein
VGPPDFGPDFTKTTESDTKPTPPKQNVRNPPKPAATAFPGKLGTNKKLRSPVRRLTRTAPSNEEFSDLERLANQYIRLGRAAQMFHPKFAAAMVEQAEDCALAWFELAENNDTVRRYILAMIEGGAWGKVITAHIPVFMAVIPEATLNRLFLKGMGLFARNAEQFDDDEPNYAPSERS